MRHAPNPSRTLPNSSPISPRTVDNSQWGSRALALSRGARSPQWCSRNCNQVGAFPARSETRAWSAAWSGGKLEGKGIREDAAGHSAGWFLSASTSAPRAMGEKRKAVSSATIPDDKRHRAVEESDGRKSSPQTVQDEDAPVAPAQHGLTTHTFASLSAGDSAGTRWARRAGGGPHRLRQDAGVPDPHPGTVASRQVVAAQRHRRHSAGADTRAGHTNIWRVARSGGLSHPDARSGDGWGEPAQGGGQAGQRRQCGGGHARPPARPSGDHARLRVQEPTGTGHRRGGPLSGDRFRGGDAQDHPETAPATTDAAVLGDADHQSGGPGARLFPTETAVCGRARHLAGGHRRGTGTGFCAGAQRAPLPAAVHVSQAHPAQEGDRVHVIVQRGQILRRAAQLHRHSGVGPARQTETEQAHHHVFRVLSQRARHPALYRRGGTRTGHSGGGLDRTIRSTRRAQGVHSPRRSYRARRGRQRARAAVPAAHRGGFSQVPARCAHTAERVRIPGGQGGQHPAATGATHREELLSEPVGQARLSQLPARVRQSLAEAHFRCARAGPGGGGPQFRVHGAAARGPAPHQRWRAQGATTRWRWRVRQRRMAQARPPPPHHTAATVQRARVQRQQPARTTRPGRQAPVSLSR
eukprot:ctg_698.g349